MLHLLAAPSYLRVGGVVDGGGLGRLERGEKGRERVGEDLRDGVQFSVQFRVVNSSPSNLQLVQNLKQMLGSGKQFSRH